MRAGAAIPPTMPGTGGVDIRPPPDLRRAENPQVGAEANTAGEWATLRDDHDVRACRCGSSSSRKVRVTRLALT